MMVLSVRQPWAWMIIHAGKDIENRTWATNHRGPLAIHASKGKPTKDDMDWCVAFASERGVRIPADVLEYGVVIGQVDLIDCVTESDSRWWMGPVGWQLANPRSCEPWPLRGQLGLFAASQNGDL